MLDLFASTLPVLITHKTHTHFRWLKQLLHHSTGFLQTTIHQCSQTDEKLIERFSLTKDKLEALQKRTTYTTETLRLQVQGEMVKLCGKIAAILTQEKVQRELQDWSQHRIPDKVSEIFQSGIWGSITRNPKQTDPGSATVVAASFPPMGSTLEQWDDKG